MAAGDRIFMAKESTSQEILSNTKKIIEDAKAKPKRYGMRINLLRNSFLLVSFQPHHKDI